ncbi:Hypothetical protein FKW44_011595 [Caligus rogercresseyi]|uniref:Uncharacterized protein n=1 Tax=Caligus rogercresseyi TaxID=217165 RepID=A0A7T8K9T4_CALRO|nr:Hypothetical protein FKW44_011595 [Caligus rogercresseyi]
MVDRDVDSKNASVAGQHWTCASSWWLLSIPHKPWNRYREFLLFLEQRQVSVCCFLQRQQGWMSLQGSSSPNIPL